MREKLLLKCLFGPVLVVVMSASYAKADDVGVHCQIDGLSFDGDPDATLIDYVIPPGGKPPRFRIIAMHAQGGNGTIEIQLKTHESLTSGSAPLSQEPTWKSVVKLPTQQDSAITEGNIKFSHFEPGGDSYAAGTVEFKTIDAHHGECRFRLRMTVMDLAHLAP